MIRTVSRVAGLSALAGLVLTACGSGGGSGSPTSAATAGSSSPSLAAQVVEIDNRLDALDQYVVTTRKNDSDGTTTTTSVHRGDDRAVTVTGAFDAAGVQALKVGADTWVKCGARAWQFELDPSLQDAALAAKAQTLAGHWVLATGTRAAGYAADESGDPFKHPDDTTRKGSAVLDGRTVDVYSDPVALTTIYVSRGEEPLPVRVEGMDGTVVTYSAFHSAPAITAPPTAQVVDGRSILPT